MCPTTEQAFLTACESLDVDIISLDLSTRLAFSIKPKQVKLAISRGIHFEISYAPAIRGSIVFIDFSDSSCRRNIISGAQSLIRATKGKNTFVSSAARTALELRGPYDIMNL